MNSSDMVYFAAQRTGFIELRTIWVLASNVSKIKWQVTGSHANHTGIKHLLMPLISSTNYLTLISVC